MKKLMSVMVISLLMNGCGGYYDYYYGYGNSKIKIPPLTRAVSKMHPGELRGGIILGTGSNSEEDYYSYAPLNIDGSSCVFLKAGTPFASVGAEYSSEGPGAEIDLYPLKNLDVNLKTYYNYGEFFPSCGIYLISSREDLSPYIGISYFPKTMCSLSYTYYDTLIDEDVSVSSRTNGKAYAIGIGVDYNKLKDMGITFGLEFYPYLTGRTVDSYYYYDGEIPTVIDTVASAMRIGIGAYIRF